jgi:hypothetical protein
MGFIYHMAYSSNLYHGKMLSVSLIGHGVESKGWCGHWYLLHLSPALWILNRKEDVISKFPQVRLSQ